MTQKIKDRLRDFLPLIIFIILMGLATVLLWPKIAMLSAPEGQESFKAWVNGIGFLGWLATLGIQLIQIFIAFIPGEPVELMMGYVWGPWLGTFTCLLGIFIGTSVIFMLVKKFGQPFVRKAVRSKDLSRFSFLSDPIKRDSVVFILFFIPGTPKDALTYIVPLFPMNAFKYLLISTFARIPSVITSTVLGGSLADGNYILAIITFVATALITVLGAVFGNAYIKKKQAKGEKMTENANNC